MKIQLESTDKVVDLSTPTGTIPARLWQGHTEKGIEIHAFITRIGVEENQPAEAFLEFEQDLQEQAPVRPDLAGIPLHLVL